MKNVKAQLTDALINEIVGYISAGTFELVAAEAAGISKRQFNRWIAAGSKQTAKQAQRRLYKEVVRAKAQARALAEIELYKGDKRTWLKSGPGKEQPGSPGWSREAKPTIFQTNQQVNVTSSPEWNALLETIIGCLSPFPEARQAISKALLQFENQKALPPPKPPKQVTPIEVEDGGIPERTPNGRGDRDVEAAQEQELSE